MLQFCQRSNRHTNLASRIPSVIADSARATTTVRQTRPLVTMAGSTQQARFSKGTDEAAAASRLDALVLPAGEGGAAAASASAEGRWTLAKEGEALERSFKFKTFAKTWDFMTAVSLQCKLKNHHPEWSNVYNTTFIRWTTHNPKGLSHKDLELAAICDSIARDFGELEPEPSSCAVVGLADRAVETGGDCCTPKK